jgi:hypothetical protein
MEAKYVQTQTVYSFELSEDAQHVAEGDGGPMFRPTMMLVEVTGDEVTSVALSGPRQLPTDDYRERNTRDARDMGVRSFDLTTRPHGLPYAYASLVVEAVRGLADVPGEPGFDPDRNSPFR